jgi:hypothetical protein
MPADGGKAVWVRLGPALRIGGRMASMHASRNEKAPHYQQLEISLFKLLSPMSAARSRSQMHSISGR